MMTEKNWINQVIDDTQNSHSKVSKAVISLVTNLLEGEFAKRKFTPAEIKKIAEQLIARMNNTEVEHHENKNN